MTKERKNANPVVETLKAKVAAGKAKILLIGDVNWTFWVTERMTHEDVTWSIGPYPSRRAADDGAAHVGIAGYGVLTT